MGQDVVLNKKGTTWRKLTTEEQENALANENNLITTLTTHTSLIKRPVLQTATGFIAGFDEAAYRELKTNRSINGKNKKPDRGQAFYGSFRERF